jgi:hypothetical protein
MYDGTNVWIGALRYSMIYDIVLTLGSGEGSGETISSKPCEIRLNVQREDKYEGHD